MFWRRDEQSKFSLDTDEQNLPGGFSAVVPPDPMPNSEVKRRSADGSVGSPHVRVGHRQAPLQNTPDPQRLGVFALGERKGG